MDWEFWMVQAKAEPTKPKESLLSLLVNNVLKNPFIWGMAFTYFFIYVVRQGVTSWFIFYLIKVMTLASLPVSVLPCSSLEPKGVITCLLNPKHIMMWTTLRQDPVTALGYECRAYHDVALRPQFQVTILGWT